MKLEKMKWVNKTKKKIKYLIFLKSFKLVKPLAQRCRQGKKKKKREEKESDVKGK